jgi:DNA polymerase III epsilon subunit-like protein
MGGLPCPPRMNRPDGSRTSAPRRPEDARPSPARDSCPDADGLAWVDTVPWAKRVYPSQTSHGLQPLAAALKLPTGTAHRALGDVRTLAALATRLYAVSGALPAAAPARTHTPARPAPASLTLAGATP